MDIFMYVLYLWNIIITCHKIYIYGMTAQTEGDVGYNYNEESDVYHGIFDSLEDSDAVGIQPTFDVHASNISVIAGQDTWLPCSIDNLGEHKVVWLDGDFNALTYVERRTVDDTRFNILRPYIQEWNLQINEVRWEDQGVYRCTINTNPVTSKTVMLHVKVPARIIDEYSSDDIIVEEGETVVLVCNVTGVPKPTVTWFRRPAHGIVAVESESKKCKFRYGPDVGTGEMVIISNITRYCDFIYECVAKNDVGERDSGTSRQMRVSVEFPPEVNLPNAQQWQARGKETILECIIYAYPQAQSYWLRDGRQVKSSSRFSVETYNEEYSRVVLTLRIIDLEPKDFGRYSCFASNRLGNAQEHMKLIQIRELTPPTSIAVPTPKEREKTIHNGNVYYNLNPVESKSYDDNQPESRSLLSTASSHTNSVGKLQWLTVIVPVIYVLCTF